MKGYTQGMIGKPDQLAIIRRTLVIYLLFAGIASGIYLGFRGHQEVFIMAGAILLLPQTLFVLFSRDVVELLFSMTIHMFFLVCTFILINEYLPEVLVGLNTGNINFRYLVLEELPGRNFVKYVGFSYICFSAFFLTLGSIAKQLINMNIRPIDFSYFMSFVLKVAVFSFVVFVLVESTQIIEEPSFRGPASIEYSD